MEKKKVLVADAAADFCRALADVLESSYTLQLCHDGREVEPLLQSFVPDVLVMDLALPGLDGITLLGRINTLSRRPKLLVTTPFLSPYIEQALSNCKADMIMVKPCSLRAMEGHIQDMIAEAEPVPVLTLHRCSSVPSMLMELNIPAKRRGFTYLQMCVELYMENPGAPLTKVIYPAVAKQYATRVDAVERAMRQVIHETWDNRDDRVWRRYFHPLRDGQIPRPTNAEFISSLAEILKQSAREYA